MIPRYPKQPFALSLSQPALSLPKRPLFDREKTEVNP
jgi:hypothetical protein